MIKKKILIVSVLTSCIFCFVSILIGFNNNSAGAENTEVLPYSLDLTNLDSNNKRLVTKDGNTIKFSVNSYDSCIFNNGANIRNMTALSGIKELYVDFVTQDADLTISYGWEDNNYDVIDAYINSDLSVFNFDNDGPSFFNIKNENEFPIEISSIIITYSCEATFVPSKYALTFELGSDDTYSVKSCKQNVDRIEIPATYKNKDVTNISSNAFFKCSSLTYLYIPETISYIPSGAFDRCSSLSQIEVSEFNGNYFVEEDILYSSDHKYLLFCSISKSGDVVVPYGVQNIGSYAFGNCSLIRSIELPYTVKYLSSESFIDCSALESINIPSYIKRIPISAFENCTSLKSIELPEDITNIGSEAFSNCSSLESIELPPNITSISMDTFKNCSSLTSIVIPEKVTDIKMDAFRYCSSLETVILDDFIETIGSGAFAYCSSLTTINLPDSITSIGSSAFAYCASLESITLPDSIDTLYGSTFNYCSSLQSIVISETVTSIGNFAFHKCESLLSVSIPQSIHTIGNYVFQHCTSLREIYIPDTLVNIGTGAFVQCDKLLIYCQADEKLDSWDESWNCDCPVVWNYSGEWPALGFGVMNSDGNGFYARYVGTDLSERATYLIDEYTCKEGDIFQLYVFHDKNGWVENPDGYSFGGSSDDDNKWENYLFIEGDYYRVLQDFKVKVYLYLVHLNNRIYFELIV